MPIQITIRNVPEKVRDELAARAALQGNPCRNICGPSWSDWHQSLTQRANERAVQTTL